ncbi:MAG TPA: aminotransferase class III-fold pyridoxal phosphate-dependent enzyme [Gaiellaceae bacterium]|nr:aminotransferase class III-fold pyridoxal phosphate-dependent enzyme [Gaiellaceae bacterium]
MLATTDLAQRLAEAEDAYVAANPESRRLHGERALFMPGGNTRTTIHQPPFPLTIVRGDGARITDADGHTYTDFLGEYTAGLYGHSHPVIVEAIREALADGIALGAPNRYEAVLAEAVCTRFPSVDLVRFCNSGTEANLLALSLSRAVTGRNGVLVFAGAYHGGILLFAHGVSPLNPPFQWLVGEYNDADGAVALIAEHAHELAAVIVEPLQGAAGVIPADPGFLRALREATAENDVLLVFDEVMTSRLSKGGRQQLLGIDPDVTTLAKFVGGGLSFGAFGGRADLMSRFDPSRPDALQHGGTFNNDVLTMAAGAAGLTRVLTEAEIARLNGLGDRLRDRLNAFAVERGIEFCATGLGSLVGLHFTRGPVRNVHDVPETAELRGLLHLHMLERGFSYGRRGFIALSFPLDERDIDGFAAAVEEFLAGA